MNYNRWLVVRLPIRCFRVCYNYYLFRDANHLVRGLLNLLVWLNSVSGDYSLRSWSLYHLCDSSSGWKLHPCSYTHCWRS
jgi:hypothetical protein